MSAHPFVTEPEPSALERTGSVLAGVLATLFVLAAGAAPAALMVRLLLVVYSHLFNAPLR